MEQKGHYSYSNDFFCSKSTYTRGRSEYNCNINSGFRTLDQVERYGERLVCNIMIRQLLGIAGLLLAVRLYQKLKTIKTL